VVLSLAAMAESPTATIAGETPPASIPSSIILITQSKVPFIVQVHITNNSEANLLTSLLEKPLPRLTQPFSHGLVNLLKSLPEELS